MAIAWKRGSTRCHLHRPLPAWTLLFPTRVLYRQKGFGEVTAPGLDGMEVVRLGDDSYRVRRQTREAVLTAGVKGTLD